MFYAIDVYKIWRGTETENDNDIIIHLTDEDDNVACQCVYVLLFRILISNLIPTCLAVHFAWESI